MKLSKTHRDKEKTGVRTAREWGKIGQHRYTVEPT